MNSKVSFVVLLIMLSAPVAESDLPNEAAALNYLSDLEKQIVREVNQARSNPGNYAAFLEQKKPYYNGRRIERSGKPTILTEEGVVAVEEAIRFLRSIGSRAVLTPSIGMSLAAKDHVKQLGSAGAIGHKGLHGSWPTDRVNRYGTWREALAENIYYGRGIAREVVIGLIVDDGVPSRAHRRNLFDSAFRIIGVGCGAHATYSTMCVMTFAGNYVEQAPKR